MMAIARDEDPEAAAERERQQARSRMQRAHSREGEFHRIALGQPGPSHLPATKLFSSAGCPQTKLMGVRMRNVLPALMMIAVLALPSSVANATPMTFTAVLSGANELPIPNNSPGTGLATVVLDPTAQT